MRSVADGEAAAAMGRLLQLVDQCDRIILGGDRAAALGVDQKLVGAEAELAGALARLDQGRGREEGPVEALLLLQQIEEGAALAGLVEIGGRKFRGVEQLHARRDLETAGAADDEIALHARLLHRREQPGRVAGGKVNGADHGVMAGDQGREPVAIEDIALAGSDAGTCRHLLGIADAGGDLVAAAGQFGEQARADKAGCAGESDKNNFRICSLNYINKGIRGRDHNG